MNEVNVFVRVWTIHVVLCTFSRTTSQYGTQHPHPSTQLSPSLAQNHNSTKPAPYHTNSMSTDSPTRAAHEQRGAFASRHWSPAQMVAALHRVVAHNYSERSAVEWANSHTPSADTHCLSRSSFKRMYDSLPPSLLDSATSSEVLLLQHVQIQQGEARQQLTTGLTMLTAVEEALLADWIVRQYNMNAPASPLEIRERARGLLLERSGKFYDSSLRRWYDLFMRRYSTLSVRVAENMPKSRLTAEQKQNKIAHFFTLLAEWKHLKPEQIYASDETGLSEDGSRRQKVVVPKGSRRVYRNSFGFYEHVSILQIGNAVGIPYRLHRYLRVQHMMLSWLMTLRNSVVMECTERRKMAILHQLTSFPYCSTLYDMRCKRDHYYLSWMVQAHISPYQ